MKAINIKSVSFKKAKFPMNDSDVTPCYYAKLEKADKRKEWKWTLGCKFGDVKEKYSFKLSKIADITDESNWTRFISAEFAIELIELFRNGGEPTVKEWIKIGCP